MGFTPAIKLNPHRDHYFAPKQYKASKSHVKMWPLATAGDEPLPPPPRSFVARILEPPARL